MEYGQTPMRNTFIHLNTIDAAIKMSKPNTVDHATWWLGHFKFIVSVIILT